jgi:hypothetical protein
MNQQIQSKKKNKKPLVDLFNQWYVTFGSRPIFAWGSHYF